MKGKYLLLHVIFLVLVISPSAFAANPDIVLNRIEGTVYAPNRVPIENVYMELMNDVNSVISRSKTNSSGRFTFTGLSSGKFLLKAMPVGTAFLEQTQEVYITTLTPTASDIAYVDFYLVVDKRFSNPVEKAPESIFVQEIPPAAKRLYVDGENDLKKNQDKGLVKVEEALNIFPTYFDALNLLGKHYVLGNNYEKAYPYLLRAIDINPRSFSCFYRLGYAFYQLKQYPAALEATKATIILAPDSIDAHVLHGTILRILENYTDSEKILLKANSLAKGSNPEAHMQLALLYNRLNRNQSAVDELETYLKLVPNSPDKSKIQALIAKLKSSGSTVK